MVRIGLLTLVVVVLAGCNRPPYELATVHGKVTIDGEPMKKGKVMFAPVAREGLNSGRPAFGVIKQDGSFVLSTYGEDDGAVVGNHWVSVANGELAADGASLGRTNRAGGKTNKQNFKHIRFPRKTVPVVAGQENQIDIQLTSQDIEMYGRQAEADD
jgi:hypothetical protein